MKDIINLSQNRGFVYQGSEIYGGLSNTWDYGPYGSIMKENIKHLWMKEFIQKRDDMVMLDSSILMNPQVWVASGHVGGFSDPLIDDKNTKQRFRADKLLEDYIKNMGKTEQFKKKYSVNNLIPESWSLEKQTEIMKGEQIKNPDTGKTGDWSDVKRFNLMFKTHQGVTDDSGAEIYLRPETAQGIFVNFPNIVRTSRKKIPFGIAQVGKAFRNEITPGNFIFRTREFEQMEIEYFCEPGTDLELHSKWKQNCMSFLTDKIGIRKNSLRFRDHELDELSHYSKVTTDIEFMFPFGWGELWGIADRTDFDLRSHMKHSRQDLSYFDQINSKKYLPYVIEPSVGLTRLFLASLVDSYTIDEKNNRTYLKLHPQVAPIKIGILPVVKKLSDLGKKLYSNLSEHFICEYDDVGSIGKRYARFDEIGTPYCITIDSENYDNGDVTIRFRDTMEQKIMAIDELYDFIKKDLN